MSATLELSPVALSQSCINASNGLAGTITHLSLPDAERTKPFTTRGNAIMNHCAMRDRPRPTASNRSNEAILHALFTIGATSCAEIDLCVLSKPEFLTVFYRNLFPEKEVGRVRAEFCSQNVCELPLTISDGTRILRV
jgi:hypothetical protein